ncbi:hypothetical protein K443DRAFT_503171 [Laccaria amethystina LaAM-08-1]|uniref:Uncharacterized protein n=1 Tax=Laccaria amethystina LaAM-08-1 TaxID=1095629 RepID=A0A0C9Y4H8_9AGAR|nr:hypothetical protein K443DRAFT_503171 [Laccaria amethystina LaAM-08-1]
MVLIVWLPVSRALSSLSPSGRCTRVILALSRQHLLPRCPFRCWACPLHSSSSSSQSLASPTLSSSQTRKGFSGSIVMYILILGS